MFVDRVGLVGLPNSGKSSLFNALTGGNAMVAPHPFSTVETEVGRRPCSRSASRRAGEDEPESQDRLRGLRGRRHRRCGQERPRRATASAAVFLPGCARSTPCAWCCEASRTRTCPVTPTPRRALGPRARARPGRRGDSRTAAHEKAQPGRPARPGDRGRAKGRAGGLGGSRAGHALVPLGPARRGAGGA